MQSKISPELQAAIDEVEILQGEIDSVLAKTQEMMQAFDETGANMFKAARGLVQLSGKMSGVASNGNRREEQRDQSAEKRRVAFVERLGVGRV